MNIGRNMNKKDNDKWLKNLRERMEDYSEPLPAGLWEELEGELNRPKVIPFWRKWPSIAAAIALVLVVSSLSLSYLLEPLVEEKDMQLANQLVFEHEGSMPVSEKVVRTTDDDTVKGETSEEAVGQLAKENVVTRDPVSKNAIRYLGAAETEYSDDSLYSESTHHSTDAQFLAAASHPTETNQSVAADDTSETQTGTDAAINRSSETQANADASAPRYPNYTASVRTRTTAEAGYSKRRKKTKNAGGFEVGLLTGGIPFNSSKQFGGMSRMASYHLSSSNTPIVMGSVNSKTTPYNRVLFSNRDKQTFTNIKHRMPINVVASLKWYFADDWAIESGLSYTFLQSELHSGSQLYWEDTQKLHYVGIPLKIHRNIWGNSRFSVYASVGGMIEKCVSGSLESVYATGEATPEVENYDVNEHPFQWSLTAAVGGQVNLIRQLSMFVEPGLAYYFDDNSQMETIRKEHPLNFNLQFGLRFSFF